MALTPTRAVEALATALEAVGTLGLVHRYRRIVRTRDQVSTVLLDPVAGKLNAAYVTIVKMLDEKDYGGNGRAGVLSTFTLQAELLRGVEDAAASEVAFRTTVFDVMHSVNAGGPFCGEDAKWQGAMVAPEMGYLVYAGDVLVHYAKLQVDVRGRTAP